MQSKYIYNINTVWRNGQFGETLLQLCCDQISILCNRLKTSTSAANSQWWSSSCQAAHAHQTICTSIQMMSAWKTAYELLGQCSNIKCGTQHFQWAVYMRKSTDHLHHMPETVHDATSRRVRWCLQCAWIALSTSAWLTLSVTAAASYTSTSPLICQNNTLC